MKLSNIICPVVRELVRDLKQHAHDSLVRCLMTKFAERAEAGFCKYRTTLARKDITRLGWLKHAQEEALDLAAYLEAIVYHHGPHAVFAHTQLNVINIAALLEEEIQAESQKEKEGRA